MLKTLSVSELVPGMLVTRVIEQAGPMKIRKVGMVRSPDMIKGLQEMGVVTVEVDLAQSLGVEFDTDADANINANPGAANNAQAPKQTATQRLVASNKQVADVDRQLSQQFHRSLFLPAVDQMPSKWTLYGKPYGYLLGFILLGLSIGWLGASGTQYLSTESASNDVITDTSKPSGADIPQNSVNERELLAGATGADNASDQNMESKTPEVDAQQNVMPTTRPTTRPNAEADQTPTNNQLSDTNALAANQVQNSQANTPTDDTNTRQYESVNGVILESGQQVLGYRGEEQNTGNSLQAQLEATRQNQAQNQAQNLSQNQVQNQSNNQQSQIAINTTIEDENPVITNAPGFTTITEPSITNFNNDLLRKAQRAAELVDSQSFDEPEPVLKVTDLNTLPRIDQLTPAILTQMPSMSFSAHMYASNPQDRWVRVNGRRLGEGEYITDGLLIKQIESEKVVLSFRERDFTMNALTDW